MMNLLSIILLFNKREIFNISDVFSYKLLNMISNQSANGINHFSLIIDRLFVIYIIL